MSDGDVVSNEHADRMFIGLFQRVAKDMMDYGTLAFVHHGPPDKAPHASVTVFMHNVGGGKRYSVEMVLRMSELA